MSAKVWYAPLDGPPLASGADALRLIYTDGADEADLIVVPVARLSPDFFDLRSGLAGELVQKFANHRVRLAFVGDVAEHVAASAALRDFVRESNRGQQVWFSGGRSGAPHTVGIGNRVIRCSGLDRGLLHACFAHLDAEDPPDWIGDVWMAGSARLAAASGSPLSAPRVSH